MFDPKKLIPTILAVVYLTAAPTPVVRLSARQQVPAPAAAATDFVRDIQPILEANCYECHGPKKARGQLRLDRKSSVFDGRDERSRHRAGDSENSLLVRRLLGLDGEDRMPLDKDPLPDAQIALIRRWIDQGAAWPDTPGEVTAAMPSHEAPQHWAYVKPVRHAPPAVATSAGCAPPSTASSSRGWTRKAWRPSPEASRESLLRRVSLDLIGLPPTPQEIDAFLADTRPTPTSASSIACSPRRTTASAGPGPGSTSPATPTRNGYEKDGLRTMWKYRDWVIDALNRDMPFDQFTIEQLAGDLLPNATTDAADRHRLPPQHAAQPGRRHRRRGGALGDARRSRQHDGDRLARLDDRLRAVPQPQVRPVLAARLLPPARVLRQRRVHGRRAAGRRSLDRGAAARSADAGAGQKRTALAGGARRRSKRSSTRPIAAIDAAQPEWEQSMVAADRAVDAARPADVARRQRTVLATQPDGSVLPAGRRPTDRVLRRASHDAAARDHRHPPRSAARPVAAAGRSRPRLLRQLRPHRVHRATAPASGRAADAPVRLAQGTRPTTVRQQRPARSADEAGRRQRRPARRLGDRCHARRDAAAAPGGVRAGGASGASGRRRADADAVVRGHRGQPGARALPPVGHRRRRADARRRDPREDARRAAIVRRPGRSDDQKKARDRGQYRGEAAALAPLRKRIEATARRRSRTWTSSSALVHAGAPVATSGPSTLLARARQLPVEGREACTRARRACCRRCPTTRCPTGSASRAGW